MIRNRGFLELLVSKGILTEQSSRALILKFGGDDFAILTHLVRLGLIPRVDLGRYWGDSIGVPYVELKKILYQRDVVQKLPEDFARKNRMVLLYQFGDAITAAMCDASNRAILTEAQSLVQAPISPVFSFPEEIEDAIEIEYQSYSALKELSSKIDVSVLYESGAEITQQQLEKLAGDQAVVEFTRAIMLWALKDKASDIHIEPGEKTIRIRFRVDGLLQEKITLQNVLLPPLVSRIKIMASLDISERRRPQDGRIRLTLANRSIDLRISCIPTICGEKIVLRILGQMETEGVPDLTELGFSKVNYDQLLRVAKSPSGIFLVTGPTSSGKTTTLYSLLKHMNSADVNIMTIEDPVEYRLPGINQVQVNPAIDLDFATALRSFLRQDPDIILIGEIRDLETAKIAAQAALTGHLVLATLHTNTALQSFARLVDIGVEPFLVAASIIGVMSQRLIRRICDNCREKYKLPLEEIENHFLSDGETEVYFYRGKGCSQCNNTGFSGRIAVHEVCLINEELRALVARGANTLEINACAKKHGLMTLRYDGLKKVLRGLTTLDEVDSVALAEE